MTDSKIILIEKNLAAATETLIEDVGGKKTLKIQGPFLMFDKENRNGRIYPEKVMTPAVEKYLEEYVKPKRALGELNHPCFDRTANVFVEGKGLIPIQNVQIGDYVYGMNEKWETIPVKVLNTTKNHFKGDLINFSSRSFKATVTPYHRFYMKNRYGNLNVKTANEIAEDMVNEKSTLSHDYIPLTMENWVGNDEEIISFLPHYERQTKNSIHSYANSPLEMSFHKFCAFMGIYLAEGHLTYYKRNDGRKTPGAFGISQNVGSALDLIIDLVDSIGFHAYKVRSNDGKKATIEISDIRMADYLEKFGDCYAKFVPEEILSSTKENIKEFLDWFNLGDGSATITSTSIKDGSIKDYRLKTVFTTSEKLADGLIECILKSGYSTTKRVQLSKEDYIFANRTIEVKNKNPLYRMTIGNSKGKYADGRFTGVSYTSYDDDVFCLTTETGNFFVEQHGTNFLSGNCGRISVDPERACIVTESLEKDGKYYIGKAKVLSTPLGQLLANLLNDGIKIGVSSRGLGSTFKKDGKVHVKNDYEIRTAADVVFDPSVADAFVECLMEDTQYLKYGNILVEKDLFESRERIRRVSMSKLEEQKLIEFQNFMDKISAR